MDEVSHVPLSEVARSVSCPPWFAQRVYDAGKLTDRRARLLGIRLVARAEAAAVAEKLQELMASRGITAAPAAEAVA